MKILNKDELYQLYIVQNKDRKTVASHFGVTVADVKSNLSMYDIRKKDTHKPNALDKYNDVKNDVIEFYINQNNTRE